jgi:hypothetical protein
LAETKAELTVVLRKDVHPSDQARAAHNDKPSASHDSCQHLLQVCDFWGIRRSGLGEATLRQIFELQEGL